MKNQAITDDRGISITFQGQKIKEGSFLYSFEHCVVIQVLSLIDCGDEVCAAYLFKRADFVLPLNSKTFCTIPTLAEAEAEKEKINFAINTGTPYQTIDLFKGKPNENPLIDNLLTTDGKLSVVRFASVVDADAEGFTVNSRFIICKFKNGAARTKAVAGLGSFLHVFFENRAKELQKRKEEANANVKTGKAVAFILEKMYSFEFITKDQTRQHKDELTFVQWLKENELI